MNKFNSMPDCTFGQAISRFFRKYAQFKGTASRSEYWWAWLFYVGVSSVLELVSISCNILDVLLVLWEIAIAIPALALTCRRLHDGGFSGKFIWLAVIPILGEIAVMVIYALPTRKEYWKEEWFV